MPRTLKYTREILAPIVAEYSSIAQVVRALGLRQGGGTQANISRLIRRHGIPTDHFLGMGWNKRGLTRNKLHWSAILVRRPEGSPRTQARMLRRALLESGVEEACATCGLPPEWMGKPLRLHIDHLDGDFLNNEPANLRFLCPNCHAQTATWGRTTSAPMVEQVDTQA